MPGWSVEGRWAGEGLDGEREVGRVPMQRQRGTGRGAGKPGKLRFLNELWYWLRLCSESHLHWDTRLACAVRWGGGPLCPAPRTLREAAAGPAAVSTCVPACSLFRENWTAACALFATYSTDNCCTCNGVP